MSLTETIDVQPSDEDRPTVLDWLSARYLLRSLDNAVIDECYELIVSSFKNKKEILNILIKSLTVKQIKNVIKILKTAQTKQLNKKNNDKKAILKPNGKKRKKKIKNQDLNKTAYFDHLSQESIYDICEF